MRSLRHAVFAVLVVLWPGLVLADDFVLTPSVAQRRYSPGGHFEISAAVGVGVFNGLTDHTTLQISGAYNFWDWLAAELRVTYAFSRWAGVTGEVARRTLQRDPL